MLRVIKQNDNGSHKISLMKDDNGVIWIHTNNYRTNKNSTLIKFSDVPKVERI
jgi:hypothetical protein